MWIETKKIDGTNHQSFQYGWYEIRLGRSNWDGDWKGHEVQTNYFFMSNCGLM